MLKEIKVFDKDVFKKGTPVKVHFPGGSNNDFFAIVEDCHLEHLHLMTVLPPDCKALQYTKNRVTWYHEDEDIKGAVIKIETLLAKNSLDRVEILLLEKGFILEGFS